MTREMRANTNTSNKILLIFVDINQVYDKNECTERFLFNESILSVRMKDF